MTFNGLTWLIFLLFILVTLFVVAMFKENIKNKHTMSALFAQKKQASKNPLSGLYNKLVAADLDVNFLLRKRHIVVLKDNVTRVLITIDKDNNKDTRKLGDVTIINYIKEPKINHVINEINTLIY